MSHHVMPLAAVAALWLALAGCAAPAAPAVAPAAPAVAPSAPAVAPAAPALPEAAGLAPAVPAPTAERGAAFLDGGEADPSASGTLKVTDGGIVNAATTTIVLDP